MGWMMGVLGIDSQWGLGIFLFTTVSRMALGPTQLPIQWVLGALSLRVKQQGCEAVPPLPQYAARVRAFKYQYHNQHKTKNYNKNRILPYKCELLVCLCSTRELTFSSIFLNDNLHHII
jgi:hypothetical protein